MLTNAVVADGRMGAPGIRDGRSACLHSFNRSVTVPLPVALPQSGSSLRLRLRREVPGSPGVHTGLPLRIPAPGSNKGMERRLSMPIALVARLVQPTASELALAKCWLSGPPDTDLTKGGSKANLPVLSRFGPQWPGPAAVGRLVT